MDHSKFTDASALVEFLKQNGIPASLSSQADPFMLHWWEFESINRITDVAIDRGDFFLAVTAEGFSLHVFDAQNDWYHCVDVWPADVSEAEFLGDIQSILASDDAHVKLRARETGFEFEWQRTISAIPKIEPLSPELKARIFNLTESLVETPKLQALRQSILDLLALFSQDAVRNPVNGLIMHRYFPPAKYEHYDLPAEFRSVLREMGQAFDTGEIPSLETIGKLLQQAKDLGGGR